MSTVPPFLHLCRALIAGLLALSVMGHSATAQQRLFQKGRLITEADGLPDDFVADMVQDSMGFLWMATFDGLVRFDGQQMKVFRHDPDDPSSIPSDAILALECSRDGQGLWMGTFNGLAYFDLKTECAESFLPDPGDPLSLPMNRVNVLTTDPAGNLWLGTNGAGIARVLPDRQGFRHYPVNLDLSDPVTVLMNTVTDLAVDPLDPDQLWIATQHGCLLFNAEKESFKHYYFEYEDKSDERVINSLREVYPTTDGRLFWGSWGRGLYVLDLAADSLSEVAVHLPEAPEVWSVRRFYQPGPGLLWANCSWGLLELDLDSGQIRRRLKNDPRRGAFFAGMLLDRDRRIWGSVEEGVVVFDPVLGQFSTYRLADPFDESWYICRRVLADPEDPEVFYVAVQSGDGLYRFDRRRERWTAISPEREYPEGELQIWDILFTQEGDLLVLAEDRLYRLSADGSRLLDYRWQPFGENPYHQFMAQDSAGEIWITSFVHGLARLDPQSGRSRIYQKELEDPRSPGHSTALRRLLVDHRQNIWLRAREGFSVYLRDRDTFLNFPYEVGASNTFQTVTNFVEGPEGLIYLSGGTGNQSAVGLLDPVHPEQGIQRMLGRREGIRSEMVRFLLKDKKGRLWVINERGLENWDPLSGASRQIDFGYGLPEEIDHMELLPNGEVAVGHRKAITFFHPDSLKVNRELPRPYLTGLKVFGEPLALTVAPSHLTGIHLQPHENFFTLDWSSLCFTLPDRVGYRYRLMGFDERWISTSLPQANYTNVPGGVYRFQLMAVNNEGWWSEPATEWLVQVDIPWWKTLWARSLAVLLLLGSAYAVYLSRLRTVRREASIKADFERKLADVEMNALRAQMNPHFVFNSLNSIDYYILQNETEKASDYLNRFSRLIRLILSNSRSEKVPLELDLEALRLYLEMESLRFEGGFDYQVQVSKDLPIEQIEIPPMLLQPFVENAVWHGLMQKEGRGQLDLILTARDGYLHCVVQDNGVGREAARQLRSKSALRRKSMGMQITQDRIGLLNQLYGTEASVRIIDLKDELGNALGTRVELVIPID